MKRVLLILFILSISLNLIADGIPTPYNVCVQVFLESGAASNSENITFNASLYEWDEGNSEWDILGSTGTVAGKCYFSNGYIVIDINEASEDWGYGDKVVINGSYDDGSRTNYTGEVSYIIGSLEEVANFVTITGGMHLVEEVELTLTDGSITDETVGEGTFSLTRGSGDTGTTVNVSAPASAFVSLPNYTSGVRGTATNIERCFSVEFGNNITELTTSFTWNTSGWSSAPTTNKKKHLLVSPDGTNWIYAENSESGISGDVSWEFTSGSPNTMKITFTTTKENALYAVSNGTIPAVTTPTCPNGITVEIDTSNDLIFEYLPVSVPGAVHILYESTNYGASWSAVSGTSSGAVTGSPGYYYVKDSNPGLGTGETVKYYTLRAYNGSDSYMSTVGSKIYVFKKDNFVQDLNLTPLPFTSYPDGIDNASDLGNSITNCNQVVKWDNVNQKYSYCIKYGSNWYNDDFTLTADGIYFMNLTTAGNKTFNGLLNMTNFTLREGLNLIYVIDKDGELDDDDPADGIDAQDLITDIETIDVHVTCSKVQQWDTASDSWNIHNDGDANPFSLNKLGAVFVTIDISEGGAASYPYKR